MFKYLVGLIFLFSYSTYSETLSDIISIGVVNTQSSSIYISTTANDLHNYKFYICSFHINDCHLIRNNLVVSEINNKVTEDLVGGKKYILIDVMDVSYKNPLALLYFTPRIEMFLWLLKRKGR